MKTPEYIIIDGDAISIRPSEVHEYLVTTKEVARGYGVTPAAIRNQQMRHADELAEGKHWVVTNCDTLGGEQSATLWTKRGVIRLGFFIRSERAKRFRDAAEDLIIRHLEAQPAPDATAALFAKMTEAMTGLVAAVNTLQVHQSALTQHYQGLVRETTELYARVHRLEECVGIGRPAPERDSPPPSTVPTRNPVVDADVQRLIMLALGGEHHGAFLLRDLLEVCERHGLLSGMISAVQPESSLGVYLSRYAGRTVNGVRVSKYRHPKARRYIFSRV